MDISLKYVFMEGLGLQLINISIKVFFSFNNLVNKIVKNDQHKTTCFVLTNTPNFKDTKIFVGFC